MLTESQQRRCVLIIDCISVSMSSSNSFFWCATWHLLLAGPLCAKSFGGLSTCAVQVQFRAQFSPSPVSSVPRPTMWSRSAAHGWQPQRARFHCFQRSMSFSSLRRFAICHCGLSHCRRRPLPRRPRIPRLRATRSQQPFGGTTEAMSIGFQRPYPHPGDIRLLGAPGPRKS